MVFDLDGEPDTLCLQWQLAGAKRSEDWSAAATPLLSAGEPKFVREALVRAKAAWRFASRRSPNKFGCGFAPLRLCVKTLAPSH
jgi:hypothetical protein